MEEERFSKSEWELSYEYLTLLFMMIKQARPQQYLSVALAAGAAASACVVVTAPAEAAAPKVDVAALKAAIIKTIEDEDERRGDGTGLGPTFVRLAW